MHNCLIFSTYALPRQNTGILISRLRFSDFSMGKSATRTSLRDRVRQARRLSSESPVTAELRRWFRNPHSYDGSAPPRPKTDPRGPWLRPQKAGSGARIAGSQRRNKRSAGSGSAFCGIVDMAVCTLLRKGQTIHEC